MFEKKSITGNLSYPVCICREDLNIQAQRRPILGIGLIVEHMTLEHTPIHSDPQSVLQVKSVVLFPIIAPPMAVLPDSKKFTLPILKLYVNIQALLVKNVQYLLSQGFERVIPTTVKIFFRKKRKELNYHSFDEYQTFIYFIIALGLKATLDWKRTFFKLNNAF